MAHDGFAEVRSTRARRTLASSDRCKRTSPPLSSTQSLLNFGDIGFADEDESLMRLRFSKMRFVPIWRQAVGRIPDLEPEWKAKHVHHRAEQTYRDRSGVTEAAPHQTL